MSTGFILALVAAVFWGASYTLSAKVLTGISPLVMLPIASGFRLLWFMLLCSMFAWRSLPQLSVKTIGMIGVETIFSTAATLCIMMAIARIGASRASMLEIIYPLFVVLFSSMFMHTQITFNMVIGGAIIMLGVAILAGELHV